MDTSIIIGIVVVVIIIVSLGIYYFMGKKKTDPKYSFTVTANNGDIGTLSEDGKKITWKSGSFYKRLTDVPSDPTLLNDGNYIKNTKTPPSGAGDDLVNWTNGDIWPVKLVTVSDGVYKVYQNNDPSGGLTISNKKK